MGEDGLHVVFGVGRALVTRLTEIGRPVRAVWLHRPPGLPDAVDWRSADLVDVDAATAAAEGAQIVYQCLNAAYTKWPKLLPPLQRSSLTAAERSGARLATLGTDERAIGEVWSAP